MSSLGAGPVGLDTAVFIYYVEDNPEWGPLVEPVFEAIHAGRLEAVTSELTLMETLVVPYRAGDEILAQQYESLLTSSRGLTVAEIGRTVICAAAQLRAALNVRTPDAIQLATALAYNCTAFVTSDRRLPTVGRLRVVQLSDNHE